MAKNSLYPGFIRLEYISNGHPHVQTLPCKPFISIGSTWFVEKKADPLGGLWTTSVQALVDLYKPLFSTTTTFTTASLWTMAAPDADPQFQEEFAINQAATETTVPVPNSQISVCFRTSAGGLARLYLMEVRGTLNTVALPPGYGAFGGSLATSFAAIVNFLKGTNSFVVGRDGGWLVAGLRAFHKTNDALRKKFLLDA